MTLAWSSETAALAEEKSDPRSLGRWAGSLIAVALIHVVGALTLLNWHAPVEPIEAPPPAIMIDLPPVPLPVPTPPPPPVIEPPKPPEPIQETVPEPKIVPPKPEVVLPPKPKPKPVQRKVEPLPPPPEAPPVAAAPRPPEPVTAPPAPAPAVPATSPTYDGLLQAQVRRNMRYPRAAWTSNVQGKPVVRFTLARDGKLLSIELVKESGHRILDEEAVATIKRAAPFPAFPPELTQAEKTWEIPVVFEILRR